LTGLIYPFLRKYWLFCRKPRDFPHTFELNGKTCLFDATWDIALRGAGFPVMPSWDGNSDTWSVTSRMSTQQTVQMPQPGQDIYSANQMSWPQREKTMAFNQALNSWLDDVRANRDDWCTIVHSDVATAESENLPGTSELTPFSSVGASQGSGDNTFDTFMLLQV
jgi:hypothetical protein